MLKIKRTYICLLLGLLAFAQPWANAQQSRTITGQVISSSDQLPLPGVNILVKGTTIGTTTDESGYYRLTVPGTYNELSFSFLGFETQDVMIENRTEINISMESATLASGEELVVVGYVSQERKDITGSVAVVSSEEFESQPNTQFGNMIQGKAAGVQVVSASGKPSEGISIRIRGVNSIAGGSDPLYVVDGVQTTDIRYINPSDIESISILKDASSAAIYGASGANGVVLVTTKKGTKKTTVNFEMYTGVTKVIDKLDVLDATQYKQLMTEMGYVTDWSLYNANTDWQDKIFQNGISQNYQLSLSGKSNGSSYYFSGGWVEDKGAVRSAKMDRYNFKANLEQEFYSWLKGGTNIAFTNWNDKDVTDNTNVSRGGVILGTLTTPPVMAVKNADGTYTANPFQDWENPVASTDAASRGYNNKRLLGNVFVEITPIENLHYKTNVGMDYSNGKYDYFLDPFSTSYGRTKQGIGIAQNNIANYWVLDNTLNYIFDVGKHSFDALVGSVVQKKEWDNSYIEVNGYSSSNVETVNAGSTIIAANGDKSAKTNSSFISHVSYQYDDKYLVTVNFRADGSSSFGPGNRWGYFPSFSLGWRLSQEDFLKNSNAITDLKLRLGWGRVGNDQIGTYAWVGGVNSGANYVFGGEIVPGTYPSSIENRDLKWETTEQTNIGADLALFKSRIIFTVDAYYKKTNDLLLWKTIPFTTGYSTALQNIGSIENKGIEFQLTSENYKGKEFQWTSDFNISFNKNEVVDTDGQDIIGGGVAERGNLSLSKEGDPLGLFYGYISEGVDPQTGMIVYRDLNNDGSIDPDNDRTVIGDPNPDYTLGFNNTFSMKGVTLNIFIQGAFGNDIFNASRIETEGLYYPTNQLTTVLDRWTTPGQETDIPKVTPNSTANTQLSSRFVEDGSYLRVKSLTLSYELPYQIIEKTGLQKVRVFATGTNLITFTDYSGFDPEVNAFGADNINQGIDYGTYPQTRTLIAGFNITF